MFEINVSDTSSQLNLADPADNPDAAASQSSTLSPFGASLSIDGDDTTYSETMDVALGDASPWWQVDLGRAYDLGVISIKNRWCDSVDDPTDCLCAMSQASLYLIDDHGVEFYSESLGDTCGKTDLTSAFVDDAEFCPAEFPGSTCVDDESFVSDSGWTCFDISAADPSEQYEMCEEPGNFHSTSEAGGEGGTSGWYAVKDFCPVSCNECVPTEDVVSVHDQSFASGVGPTVSMSDSATIPGEYSAQTTSSSCVDDDTFVSDSGLTCFDLGSAEMIEMFEMCNEPGTADQVDAFGNAYLVKYYCRLSCTDCGGTRPVFVVPSYVPMFDNVNTPGEMIFSTEVPSDPVGGESTDVFGTQETSSETTSDTMDTDVIGYTTGELVPTAQPILNTGEYNEFSGYSYSMGDKCEDDPTFTSDKGITCHSFVFAETVRCRSPTGMHDKDYNALRYEDFCPLTCGMCSAKVEDTSLADENAKLSIEVENAEGIALGVGLAVAIAAVLLVCAMCCRRTSKSPQTLTSELSEGRGQEGGGVGGVNPSGYSDDPGDAVEVKIPKTEIV
jgi:hypothetical protein